MAEDRLHPLRVQLRHRGAIGADGHTFDRIRGDKDHPASKGYTCEKALRLDHYQNGRGERVLHPLRRRPDGHVRRGRLGHGDPRGRASVSARSATRTAERQILYYGGGGQGNHLGGAYGAALMEGFGGKFRSSAVAQEKSGEIWVNGVMFGDAGARRVRALRGRLLRRQEPVDEPQHPACPDDAEGDRQRRRPGARRHRSAGHGDGRTRRLPPAGRSRARCMAVRGDGRGDRRRSGSPPRPGCTSTPTASRRSSPASARSTSPSTAASPVSTRTSSAARPGDWPPRRASPCSKTSASR